MGNFSFLKESEPRLIEGFVPTLPAFEKWTDEYLGANLDDMTGFVETAENSVFNPASPISDAVIDEKINPTEFTKKYRHNSRRKKKLYLAECPVNESLVDDIRLMELFSLIREYRQINSLEPLLYLGNGNNVTPMHWDDYENLYMVLDGEKHVDIIPNKYTNMIQPYTQDNQLLIEDMSNINYEKHPLMKDVEVLSFELKKGDMLFIPHAYWHSMKGGKKRNLAMSLWF